MGQPKKERKDNFQDKHNSDNKEREKGDIDEIQNLESLSEIDTERSEAYDVEVEIKKDSEKESDEILNPAKLVEENINLKSEIEKLNEQVEEYKKKWMYTFSEYENYRRRVRNEIETEVRNKVSKVIENFLEAIDSIDSAMNYIQDENTKAGVKLIRDIIENALLKSGAKRIEVNQGDILDPSKCEVVDFIPSEKDEDDRKISAVLKAGFEFEGRVIRPAKVVVWKKQEKNEN
ncbi:MAG: nucleotide exchange factor GrpE [Candidatus Calescibacterium sp.]|nr:nucleotide exchange factor GrpE [Candidatus Calescibacterium sp.]MCX7733242.1 nucleotide exchange factor GrpE [bacterium]MDW8086949.1 nucleotide exchange factor GrpE [Candidatus Calescibacterium sp.]